MDENLTRSEGGQTSTELQAPERSFRDEFLGQKPKESSGTKVAVGILVLIIVGGIIGGIFFLRGRSQEEQMASPSPSLIPTPFPTPLPTASPSPLPASSLSDYKIQVLNGSGVVGAAGKVVTLLEKEGAKDVAAGNASSYNFETTEVSLKTDTPATVFSTVKKALTGYTVVAGKALAATSKFDIVVTVGAK
ncbi:MAG: LytR C-terminal domain-containing protein [bacterium]|nr:LytR C-terminal domain-containing protein [bacterium]